MKRILVSSNDVNKSEVFILQDMKHMYSGHLAFLECVAYGMTSCTVGRSNIEIRVT